MRDSIEPMPAADAAPAFRWWTFCILIVYTASLLVFCGVVTMRSYSPADAVLGRLAASNPPRLPIAPFNVAHVVELGGTVPRMVCYQLAE